MLIQFSFFFLYVEMEIYTWGHTIPTKNEFMFILEFFTLIHFFPIRVQSKMNGCGIVNMNQKHHKIDDYFNLFQVEWRINLKFYGQLHLMEFCVK